MIKNMSKGVILGTALTFILAGCANTTTTNPPSVVTDVNNVLNDVTPILPSNVNSVISKIKAGTIALCNFAPEATSIAALVSANPSLTTVSSIINTVCNAVNSSNLATTVSSHKVGRRRFGTVKTAVVIVDNIPVSGALVK